MGMGIVSDSDFNSEAIKIVDELKNKTPAKPDSGVTGVISDTTKGRGNNPQVPNSLRNIIGETAITDGRQQALELAASFGISGSSVSAYTNGSTSTSSYDDRPNQPVIGQAKLRIANRARHKLMSALKHITDDKLSVASARDLSGVAKDMSAVVKHMEEVVTDGAKVNSGPTFVFYSPQTRKEEVYEVVHAKE